MDVAPLKMEPTWRNKRGGIHAISKRLVWFLVDENMIDGNLIITSSIEIGGISDHRPISLKVRLAEKKNLPPHSNSTPCG